MRDKPHFTTLDFVRATLSPVYIRFHFVPIGMRDEPHFNHPGVLSVIQRDNKIRQLEHDVRAAQVWPDKWC